MIIAMHALIYADDPETTRAFFRDVVQWPHLDTGGGWLIFKSGPSELGVHPTSGHGREDAPWSTPEHLEFSLACDDLAATMAELGGRGAEFTREPRDDGFGLTTDLVVPGTRQTLMLFQAYGDLAALTL